MGKLELKVGGGAGLYWVVMTVDLTTSQAAAVPRSKADLEPLALTL
jgi:hypothetical protein